MAASSRRRSGGRKYGKAAGKSVKSAMHREKRGTLKSGKGGQGGTVKSRKQAIAIGLSEARKKRGQSPKKIQLAIQIIFFSLSGRPNYCERPFFCNLVFDGR